VLDCPILGSGLPGRRTGVGPDPVLRAEPSHGFNHYTLTGPGDDARRFPGTIDRTELRNLDPAIDRVSLVI
jgi:hypothetical protein